MRRVDTGLFSEWLVDRLEPGDEIEVGVPAGGFTPDLAAGTHHGFVAAGSGITPVLSIAASVLAAHPDVREIFLPPLPPPRPCPSAAAAAESAASRRPRAP